MDAVVARRVLAPTMAAARTHLRLPFLPRVLRFPPSSRPCCRLPPSFFSLSLSRGLTGDGAVVGEAGRWGRHAASASASSSPFTAVLLGWLGAEERHLRRYAEIYQLRGMRVMTLVIGPGELLRLDLGREVERRIAGFTSDIVAMVAGDEREGRDSFLLFHTFSNTGWLTYGAILGNLQSRADIVKKIKGCIVDSGGDPNINPKVWAAGFGTALWKKSSSSSPNSSNNLKKEEKLDNYDNGGNKKDSNLHVTEVFLVVFLQTLFTFLLKLPDITRRLERIISILLKQQPRCPQLYLYSSADKVIPFESVEFFIKAQKDMGRDVRAYNFVSSPHVDHLRTFPDAYSYQVGKFLEECLTIMVDYHQS